MTTSAEPSEFRQLLALDTRSLALMRIGLGIILLLDLGQRWPGLEAHQTGLGVVTFATYADINTTVDQPWWFSVHVLNDTWAWQAFLALVAGGFAVALMVGFYTRVALVGSWYLLVSVHACNPVILQAGDILLRCQLCWCLFLPLGARWSYDAWRRPAQLAPVPTAIISGGTVAYIAQLFILYNFNACFKEGDEWRVDFTAGYYALSLDSFTRPWAYDLLKYPDLLKFSTAFFLGLELIGPWLLLIPVQNAWWRCLVIGAFCALHLGLHLAMTLGWFSFVVVNYWLALLPGAMWDRLARGRQQTPVVAPQVWGAPLAHAVALSLLAYVLCVNFGRLPKPGAVEILPTAQVHLFPQPLQAIGPVLGVDQYWPMFAPRPGLFGGWYLIKGERADGQIVDLWHPDQPFTWQRPANISGMFADPGWRFYMMKLHDPRLAALHQRLLAYLRERYDAGRPPHEQIVRIEAIRVFDWTQLPHEVGPPYREFKVLVRWERTAK